MTAKDVAGFFKSDLDHPGVVEIQKASATDELLKVDQLFTQTPPAAK